MIIVYPCKACKRPVEWVREGSLMTVSHCGYSQVEQVPTPEPKRRAK